MNEASNVAAIQSSAKNVETVNESRNNQNYSTIGRYVTLAALRTPFQQH